MECFITSSLHYKIKLTHQFKVFNVDMSNEDPYNMQSEKIDEWLTLKRADAEIQLLEKKKMD